MPTPAAHTRANSAINCIHQGICERASRVAKPTTNAETTSANARRSTACSSARQHRVQAGRPDRHPQVAVADAPERPRDVLGKPLQGAQGVPHVDAMPRATTSGRSCSFDEPLGERLDGLDEVELRIDRRSQRLQRRQRREQERELG